ncbi:hypothetical protein KIV40_23730, partial [Vibrio sp. D173a]|nr:hypothetical protein [Vibrio sp. D173a]
KNLAKLGGWKDTKRTGRASIKVLWEGWFKLQTILEGSDRAIPFDHNAWDKETGQTGRVFIS